jgi:hypothetical protein
MSYEQLERRFVSLVQKHEGSDPGERKIKIAAQMLDGARTGDVSIDWAMQVMKRLHGSVNIK